MNKIPAPLPLPLQHSVINAAPLNMRIFIECVKSNMSVVDQKVKGLYRPWITTVHEDVTCSISAIVTRHSPTVDDVLSLINELARSNFSRDMLLPPELGRTANHGISEVHLDFGLEFGTAEFVSACNSSEFVVVAATIALHKTRIARWLLNLDAAVTRASRVPAVKPVDSLGGAPLMDSDAVTADELCEVLREIFERNFASIEVKVGRRKQ